MKQKIRELYEKGFISLPRISFISLMHDIDEYERKIKNNTINEITNKLLESAPKTPDGNLDSESNYLSVTQIKTILDKLKR